MTCQVAARLLCIITVSWTCADCASHVAQLLTHPLSFPIVLACIHPASRLSVPLDRESTDASRISRSSTPYMGLA